MEVIVMIHSIFGERILPVLVVLTAIYLTVTWKPDARPNAIARAFPILVDIQVLLGIIYFVYGIVNGAASLYLSFPFILHPLLGLVAAFVAHRAIKPEGLLNMGRWTPLASLAILLAIVIGNVVIGLNGATVGV